MRTCERCGSEFPVKVSISGKIRNLQRRKYCIECSPFGGHNTVRLHEDKPRYACKQCGKSILRRTYCSNKCQQQFAFTCRVKRTVEAGKIEMPCVPQTARRIMFKLREHKCEICGRVEWEGRKIPLVLDHQNGNSTDWALTNLRFICPNCDAKTETFAGRNRGQGRHYRRVRYAEGKSS